MIRVNSQEIKEETILQEMQFHPSSSMPEAKKRATESLIIGELLCQRFHTVNEQHPFSIGAVECPTGLHTLDNQQVLALLDKEISIPKATETDCLRYFNQHTQKFMTSPLLCVRHILLPIDKEQTDHEIVQLDLAQKLIELLKQGADFFELAKAHSICSSASLGGSLGQLSYGQTCEEFEQQVFNHGVGLIATPITTRYGIHVVCIDDKEEGKALSFDVVKKQISEYLEEVAEQQAYSQYINYLIQNAQIEGYDF